MIFKIQIITASSDSVRIVYRFLWFFYKLGANINDSEVPTDNSALFRKFNVFWLDEDSHRVEILNCEDYDNMFRKVKHLPTPVLYLEERKCSGKSRVLGKNWGFLCSNCKIQKIAGFCYKCLECEDYRLCSDCEAGKAHKEHVVLRFDSLDKEIYFNKKFSIKKKIYDDSKMVSSNANLSPKENAPPDYDECKEMKSTSGRSRCFSDASTFGWNEDTDPVTALTTLFERFRETINQAEEKLLKN